MSADHVLIGATMWSGPVRVGPVRKIGTTAANRAKHWAQVGGYLYILYLLGVRARPWC